AGSLAAGPGQLSDGLVHHRIGLTVEFAASLGAVAGALVSTSLPQFVLSLVLAVAALIGGVAALRRKGVRNLPVTAFASEAVTGEWPGTLGGQYRLGTDVVPYRAVNVPAGMVACLGAGVVAGLSGVGGGFLKTPAMSEIMRVPVKVAAATSTFTIGVTSAAGLLVFAGQGRLGTSQLRIGAAAIVGALLGGYVGARLQSRVAPATVRKLTGGLLLAVAVVIPLKAILS
ncbi:MAG: sulfite exporter TauE/SafE family protein, partial [Actinomycetes bacterium]